MPVDTDYVLGTHDEELARLGVQHRAWRPATLAAWQSAGIARGQTVLDVGCGPGYATLDLAEILGPEGRVIAIDKSDKFLGALHAERERRGLGNITTRKLDLDNLNSAELNDASASHANPAHGSASHGKDPGADAAWCRWVFAFLTHPRDLVAKLGAAIRPGGAVVVHEYFNYATWRTAPRCAELEDYVTAVMASWRDTGGEPDIALSLLGWFEQSGFEVRARPILDVIQPDHPKWGWARTFLETGRKRLVDLGYLTAAKSESIGEAFKVAEAAPGTRMITPAVLEIVALKQNVIV